MQKTMKLLSVVWILTGIVCAHVRGQQPKGPAAIREADIKSDLFAMAADHFRGREAGTLDELKVSMWLADRAKAAGLEPAGDDGTYFQFFSMKRNRLSASTTVKIGDHSLRLWDDVIPTQTAPATVKTTIVFAGKGEAAVLDKLDVKGKAVAILASGEGIPANVSLVPRRYAGYIVRRFLPGLVARGAAAVIFVSDSMADASWVHALPALTRGTYDIENGPNDIIAAKPPVLWLHQDALDLVQKEGVLLEAQLNIEHFDYPSVNVVGKIKGTDKNVSGQYVLFSGHQDHDGIRQPYGTDSIYNGADDNASVSVALLAIARAFRQQPGRRSALFVWHGAEERGLLGSRWYSAHPTVPFDSITAVLNGDMIGRNTPDSAALLGTQPPHRNSVALVTMAMEANQEGPRFKLDTTWDKPTHIEGWYFRSDHLPYARAGIPALFYTTLLHPDYHTPMDEAARIDLHKLAGVAEWMYRTGWKVANAKARPAVDKGFKLER
ncbi:MAG: M28 family peptidase [Bacteroidetes bacterium]|nr:M28 family peptidase [Bacteroidota bacterium]